MIFLESQSYLMMGLELDFRSPETWARTLARAFCLALPEVSRYLTEAAQIVTSPNDVLKRMQLLRLDCTFLWPTHNYLLVRSLQNRVQTTWEGNDVLRCREGGGIKKNSICFASLFYFLFVCFIRHVIY